MGRQQSVPEQIGRGALPGLSTAARMGGVGAGPYLGPLSIASGGLGMVESGMSMADNGIGVDNSIGMLRGGAGVLSGAAGVTGAASTAMGAGSAGVGAAMGASALGTLGCVAGAGAAGYAVGTGINAINDSDYARSSWFGQDQYTGRDRTANEAVIDGAVAADQWVDDFTGSDLAGDIVGGTTAVLGSIAAAPVGLASAGIGAAKSFFSGW